MVCQYFLGWYRAPRGRINSPGVLLLARDTPHERCQETWLYHYGSVGSILVLQYTVMSVVFGAIVNLYHHVANNPLAHIVLLCVAEAWCVCVLCSRIYAPRGVLGIIGIAASRMAWSLGSARIYK